MTIKESNKRIPDLMGPLDVPLIVCEWIQEGEDPWGGDTFYNHKGFSIHTSTKLFRKFVKIDKVKCKQRYEFNGSYKEVEEKFDSLGFHHITPKRGGLKKIYGNKSLADYVKTEGRQHEGSGLFLYEIDSNRVYNFVRGQFGRTYTERRNIEENEH